MMKQFTKIHGISCREKHKEATEYVQRAKLIFELQYGIWNTGLQDILSKEEQLQRMLV
jgi:hypothetical protein